MASVVKDTGEIWSRLFDHRPFIQGEVIFFLREFQNKRNNREVLRLFKILEYSTELGQNQIDYAEQLGDYHLPTLKANVDVALSICDCVLQKENEFRINHKLQENREIRKDEWQKFINNINNKCVKIDQELQNTKQELKEFYSDLEKKLHIRI